MCTNNFNTLHFWDSTLLKKRYVHSFRHSNTRSEGWLSYCDPWDVATYQQREKLSRREYEIFFFENAPACRYDIVKAALVKYDRGSPEWHGLRFPLRGADVDGCVRCRPSYSPRDIPRLMHYSAPSAESVNTVGRWQSQETQQRSFCNKQSPVHPKRKG